ncbi:MAG: cytochrome [Rhizobiales bacterium]|nr:cytochrome [Hyphomicrobiales bacterium]
MLKSETSPKHIPESVVFDFDIYGDDRLTDDLHASYETLHRDAPDVFWTPRNGGHWMITRYEDIMDVVRDPEHFSVREMQIPRVEDPPLFIPLSLDPPDNIPYRQALMPFFAPKTVRAMEPKIRQFAIEMIEAVEKRGECDFVDDISSQFPVSVFMELMGMPLERLREFRTQADAFFESRSDEDIAANFGKIVAIMTELIETRRAEPKDDLISKMTQFEINGRPISLGELQSICSILFLGGMDTVTNVSSYLFRHLAGDAALQDRLSEEPEKIKDFIEEGLRSFGVVNTPRLVTKDFERFGVPFRQGDMVLCMLPLGGRDDRKTKDPNKFDIDREKIDHVTFSSGPHLCLGHTLARLEMRILTEEWLKRIPSFRLKPGTMAHSRVGTVMALEQLPLEWSV